MMYVAAWRLSIRHRALAMRGSPERPSAEPPSGCMLHAHTLRLPSGHMLGAPYDTRDFSAESAGFHAPVSAATRSPGHFVGVSAAAGSAHQ